MLGFYIHACRRFHGEVHREHKATWSKFKHRFATSVCGRGVKGLRKIMIVMRANIRSKVRIPSKNVKKNQLTINQCCLISILWKVPNFYLSLFILTIVAYLFITILMIVNNNKKCITIYYILFPWFEIIN